MSAETEDGLVVGSFGRRARVEAGDGTHFTCTIRRRLVVVTGDRIAWRRLQGEQGVIEARHPRTSELVRPDDRGRRRVMAANVDTVLVVMATTPTVTASALDAYLVAAESLGLAAALVHNKWDLLTEEARDPAEDRLRRYQRIGYPVHALSAADGTGMSGLRDGLRGEIGVLVGPSGVGKSSITRELAPQANPAVGELTRDGTLGSHTTTATHLYPLPDGGAIIDSPGIREFGLWTMAPLEIASGFPEIRAAAARCRFRDCVHSREPDCAVRAEVESGGIDRERYESFVELVDQYGGAGRP